jgi:tripartite-type tricarboxylate transporter receptor subunit TctC
VSSAARDKTNFQKGNIMLRHELTNVVLIAGLLYPFGMAQAQSAAGFPSRPVTVVVPYVPGGITDNETRLYTQKLQESTGQPFVLDFKPGATTTIGTGHVAKANPDGYTLLVATTTLTLLPNFFPDLPFDVIKSFTPITMMSNRSAAVLVSPAALPNIQTLDELVAHARANPGMLNAGTNGQGSVVHIVGAWLASATKTKLTFVHYKGVAQGVVDLIAGRTHLAPGTVFNALPHLRSGKLRAVAIIGDQRSRLMPDIKTTREYGYDVEFPSWLGAFAPAKTPDAIVNTLNAEFKKAVMSAGVVKQLESAGAVPVASTPDEFRKRLLRELTNWQKVIREENIKLTQ